MDYLAGDYRISEDSDAINAGVDAGVRRDIDFHPRPHLVPDIGADECWPPGTLSLSYLPLVMRRLEGLEVRQYEGMHYDSKPAWKNSPSDFSDTPDQNAAANTTGQEELVLQIMRAAQSTPHLTALSRSKSAAPWTAIASSGQRSRTKAARQLSSSESPPNSVIGDGLTQE